MLITALSTGACLPGHSADTQSCPVSRCWADDVSLPLALVGKRGDSQTDPATWLQPRYLGQRQCRPPAAASHLCLWHCPHLLTGLLPAGSSVRPVRVPTWFGQNVPVSHGAVPQAGGSKLLLVVALNWKSKGIKRKLNRSGFALLPPWGEHRKRCRPGLSQWAGEALDTLQFQGFNG